MLAAVAIALCSWKASREFIVIAQTMSGRLFVEMAGDFLPVRRGALWRGVYAANPMRGDRLLRSDCGMMGVALMPLVLRGRVALWGGGK